MYNYDSRCINLLYTCKQISFLSYQDFLDDIKPLLQQTKRDTTAIQYVWKSLNDHLLDDSTNESPSSLYGTPSVQKGRKMKDFYKVCIMFIIHVYPRACI